MKKVDEQIQWYEQNADRKDDDLIKANLKLINNLYSEIESSEDKIFFDKIIRTFCEIIEIQRNVINDILMNTEQGVSSVSPLLNNFTIASACPTEFADDKQLQEAFTVYMLSKGKSSYTANDYCSRIRNLWKAFYSDYIAGKLPSDIDFNEKKINPGALILNVYNYIDIMNFYINDKIATTEKNRNWLNIRAAFNSFDEFRSRWEIINN